MLASVSEIRNTEIGRELKKESIECRPRSFNTLDKSLSEVFDLFTARFFRLLFPFDIQIFDIQSGGVTLKMRSRSPKSCHSFLCPTGVYMQDWSKSTYWFRRLFADKAYYTPRKLCLWWGILFSRCPSVHPSVRPDDRTAVRLSVCPSVTLWFFSNIVKTQ